MYHMVNTWLRGLEKIIFTSKLLLKNPTCEIIIILQPNSISY